MNPPTELHTLLDVDYGPDGDARLGKALSSGPDVEEPSGPRAEPPLHGSPYSGDAEVRQKARVELVRMLIEAGSSLCYPDDPSHAYLERPRRDSSPAVLRELPAGLPST